MDGIDLDPASCDHAQKTVKADKYHTLKDNGLDQTWAGKVFLNPPYSASAGKRKFIQRLADDYKAGNVSQACVILSYDFSASWFDPLRGAYSAIALLPSRVNFYKEHEGDGHNPSSGTAVIYLGENVRRFKEAFESVWTGGKQGEIVIPA